MYTYSLLRGVTFELLPLSNDAATVGNIFGIPVAEQLSVPLSLSSISRNLCPFNADFIFGNSQKSFRP
jgi:hypothetical protein